MSINGTTGEFRSTRKYIYSQQQHPKFRIHIERNEPNKSKQRRRRRRRCRQTDKYFGVWRFARKFCVAVDMLFRLVSFGWFIINIHLQMSVRNCSQNVFLAEVSACRRYKKQTWKRLSVWVWWSVVRSASDNTHSISVEHLTVYRVTGAVWWLKHAVDRWEPFGHLNILGSATHQMHFVS